MTLEYRRIRKPYQRPRLTVLVRPTGQRALRAFLRRVMPMTNRMWKTRWSRATVRIVVGPSFVSRRQEAVDQLMALLEG